MMLSTLSLGLLALVSAKPQLKQRLVAHEEYSSDEPTICYGDDECRGKDVCDMGTYLCRPETDTPTIWTTPSPVAPNGCCHGTSYKANTKCMMAKEQGKCEEKECTWLVTEDPEDCEITTTETLEFTTTTEVGCCKGSDPKTDTMCNPKTDSKSCERSDKCAWIEDGDLSEGHCTSETFDEPGCCYGDTAKTYSMCLDKEDQDSCQRSGKCEWRKDTPTEEAVCELPTTTTQPTTTSSPAGCCHGTSYKANTKCMMAMEEGKCKDKECEWLVTEDPEDCEITTTKTVTTESEQGCCKGDSAKTNSMCNLREDRNTCDRSSSCTFVLDGVLEEDCAQPTTSISPGCCYGNPDQAYSKRWMDTCTSYSTERECLFNMDDEGNARCVFEEMNEYMDCAMLWPTTTSTPTEPAGCCHGDLSSYKANDKCVGIADKVGCERKSCTWLITDEPEDCVVSTTTTSTPTIEPGCCKADSVKREEMCLARDTREKCEKSSSCVGWISGNDADCSFESTTTESPGCCYINPAQAYSRKYQETCIVFGTERDCLKLTDDAGVTRCIFEEMNEYMDCSVLWPTTTSSPTVPAGCCHGSTYKANAKCMMAMEQGKCEDKECSWKVTEDPEDCVMTTTTSTTTTSIADEGCCKGTTGTKASNDKCNLIDDDADKCNARSSCEWIAFGDIEEHCAWAPETTSTTVNPGCCYGNPDAAYSKRWMDACKSFGTEKECTMLLHDDGTPRCVFEPLDEYEDCETLWPTTTSTTEPTTTETRAGCCMGDSYKSNDKCNMLEDQVGCERKSCTWKFTEDPSECIITTTTSSADEGCCKGTSQASNDKCNAMVDDADKCNARSSCEWIAFGVLEEDCIFEPDTPGCCYGNPAAAYSKRWMDMCKTYGTEKECTLLTHDDGTPRCVFEEMGDYEDCETVWPTTTSSPTVPAGCCHGSSYKANAKCMMAMEQGKCEDKECTWLVTEDPEDCEITTTSTTSPTTTSTVQGCCKGEDTKSNDMCNQKTDVKSCERSNSCTFIVDGSIDKECNIDEEPEPGCCYGDTAKTNEMCLEKEEKDGCERSGKCEWRPDPSDTEQAVCDLPTTTSTPWLGAQAEADYTLPYNPYKQSQQKSMSSHKSNKNNHRAEEAMMFESAGADSVVGQAMQYQVSLSSVLLMLVAAFALYQTYAWISARKNKDYAAVQSARPAQYYQSA